MNDFLRKIAEKDLYPMGKDMGVSIDIMDKFMKQRFITLMIFVIVSIPIMIYKLPIGLVVLAAGAFLYKQSYKNYKATYSNFLFQREFEFNSLMKMMIPYLKQDDGSSLYTVFGKCHRRLEPGIIKENLERLMFEMVDKPMDIKPFRDFAERSSGTDDADLIMSTIFDYQQNSGDSSVIDELGLLITERMMRSIDAIILFKTKRFGLFPTWVTMYVLLIIFSYVFGIAVYEIRRLTGGGGIM